MRCLIVFWGFPLLLPSWVKKNIYLYTGEEHLYTSVPLPVWPLPDTELLPYVPLLCLSRLRARYLLWAYSLWLPLRV